MVAACPLSSPHAKTTTGIAISKALALRQTAPSRFGQLHATIRVQRRITRGETRQVAEKKIKKKENQKRKKEKKTKKTGRKVEKDEDDEGG